MAYIKYKELTKYFNFNKIIEIDDLPEYVTDYIYSDEKILEAYKTSRDKAVFTNKRLIVRDAQGLTGTKVEIYSLPYSSILMWSTENAGIVDINSEVQIWTKIGTIKVKLRKGIDVRRFESLLANAILTN